MTAAIVLDGLVKRYGDRAVVDGVSLQVSAGEIVALLGPNGAGKTTTVEIVEGYRRADGEKSSVSRIARRLFSTVIRRKTDGSWGRYEMPARARRYIGISVTFRAPRRTSPESGVTRPTTIEKVVVLPAPFGPRRPTISPAPTSSETWLTTARPP